MPAAATVSMRSRVSRCSVRRLCVLAAGLMLAACGGETRSPSEGWSPTDLAIVDLDGNGLADVIALGVRSSGGDQPSRAAYLSIYLQTSSGAFAAPQSYPAGQSPTRLTVGDANGDEAPDVLVVDIEGLTTSLFLQDDGNRGRLLDAQTLVSGVKGGDVALADLNADGVPDVAVSDSRSLPGRIVVRYQDPAAPGTFRTAVELPMSGAPTVMAAGDVDGDGAADLLAWIVTNPGQAGVPPDARLVLRFQEAGGALGPERLLDTRSALQALRLRIADLDGDGRVDVYGALAPAIAGARGALVAALQGGYRLFAAAAATTLEGIASVDDAALADLARDARPDVVVLRTTSASTTGAGGGPVAGIYANAGDGLFTFLASTALLAPVARVAAGDLDGDGRNDLLFVGDENQVTVMYQSASQPGVFEAPAPLR